MVLVSITLFVFVRADGETARPLNSCCGYGKSGDGDVSGKGRLEKGRGVC